jgi:hypothetical protein
MASFFSRLAYTFLLLFTLYSLSAQGLAGERNAGSAFLVEMGYARQFTSGDLGDRFGNDWSIELGVDYIAEGSNWTYGIFGQYLFGSIVKEDVLASLRTSSGFVIGNQRDPTDVQLRMRGHFGGLRVGRIISLGGDNPRSGLKLAFGAGWMTHWIRIQKDPTQAINQLIGDYKTGYDRRSAGPALYQFLGYQNLSLSGRVNFYFGAEFFEGFTQERRDFNFTNENTFEKNRLDLIAGIRVGLIIPIYISEGREIYYR